ncbi:MAG TPA: glycosyl hydrolase [Streptosporangiaceae bacterium]|nr:glycosyl hydrolase [Streptosporangiaceae bacterium]
MTGRAGGARAMALVLAGVCALAGCGSDGDDAKPKIHSTVRAGVAPTPPSQGAYFGAWVDSGPRAAYRQGPFQAVLSFEQSIGRKLDIVNTYRTWDQPFPRPEDNAVLSSRRYLMLSWNGVDTELITSGSQDQIINARARAIKATGRPIFLRWQWEMDRPNIKDRIHGPDAFIAAWRHIRAIFRQNQVNNVAWVWCPTSKGFTGKDQAAAYYPGDNQVDWLCADVYPELGYEYRDLSESAAAFLHWAKAHPKPIMIGEFGVPRSYGPRRPEWLRNAAQALQKPQIKAVVYFDGATYGIKPTPRMRFSLEGDENALSAMRELATTPYFNPRNVPVNSG